MSNYRCAKLRTLQADPLGTPGRGKLRLSRGGLPRVGLGAVGGGVSASGLLGVQGLAGHAGVAGMDGQNCKD